LLFDWIGSVYPAFMVGTGGSSMNVANLQLEGLLMAIASINNVLVRKGLLTIDEVDDALRRAEAGITAEERLYEDMSPANRDAVCFPIRLLQLANRAQPGGDSPSFSDLARLVAQTKEPYNDQM
jgi:hypothetical protein